uniref:Maturation n=1 Tax=Leviviridae sp. TaxID=2027243 RepID=A0A514D1K1_9VIRU|nr:MAG: hypothetical protein H4BulkLitter24313_000001 [Leviviridae sp.]
MAGTVTSTRITDLPFSYSMKNVNTGLVTKSGVFDVGRSYSSGWNSSLQMTTSWRSGRSFMKALSDPQQLVADEDLHDRDVPDNSDELLKRTTNELKQEANGGFPTPSGQTWDHGHDFTTTKVEKRHTVATLMSSDGKASYHGPLSVYFGAGGNSCFDGGVVNHVPNFCSADWPAVDLTRGQLAINKTIPTLPKAGVAAFLGELHEGLPRLIGHSVLFRDRAHAFKPGKVAGDEYLNYQFGWLPFVSDVKKFCKAFKNAGLILKKFREDSGKPYVRRHWTFPKVRDSHVYPSAYLDWVNRTPAGTLRIPTNNTFHGTYSAVELDALVRYGQSWSMHASWVRTYQYRFTGAYSYLLSEDDSFFGRMERYVQLADRLLGIEITPDVLWELTPWSWLADWEGNIGVNISNMTALGKDNLALRWGYLMRHMTFKSYTSTSPITSYSGWSGTLHSTLFAEQKTRVKSTPFGFGLSTAAFTDRQWAILAALGLTRAHKTLH